MTSGASNQQNIVFDHRPTTPTIEALALAQRRLVSRAQGFYEKQPTKDNAMSVALTIDKLATLEGLRPPEPKAPRKRPAKPKD